MEQTFFPVTRREAERSGIPYSSEANKNALFPSRLRELRKEKGVTQDVLSKVLGVSKSTVGLWETGDTLPDAKAVYDLSCYYGVSADYLLGSTDVKTPDADTRKFSEITGLSESCLEVLKQIHSVDSAATKGWDVNYSGIINALVETEGFFQIIPRIGVFLNSPLAFSSAYCTTEQGNIVKLNNMDEVHDYELRTGDAVMMRLNGELIFNSLLLDIQERLSALKDWIHDGKQDK